MNDLEITRLCAEAMGVFGTIAPNGNTVWLRNSTKRYNPLTNSEQCLALVERFRMLVRWDGGVHGWTAGVWYDGSKGQAIWMDWTDQDLRRAICLCVAKMQATRGNVA